MQPAAAPDNLKPKEKAVSFSRPEQVLRILSEVNRLKLQVLLKYSNDGKAVRGFVENFDPDDSSVRIGGISAAGDNLLKGHDVVRVEFILLSTKLVFVSKVRARVPGRMVLAKPDRLVAIERRNNARFRIPVSQAAFIEFTDRRIDLSRFDAPFVPTFMREDRHTIARLRVDDIGLGGVACYTRFQAISELLKPDDVGLSAILYFPGMNPLQVPISIRWAKKTVAAVADGKFDGLKELVQERLRPTMGNEEFQIRETYYRMGCQFSEVSKDLDAAIRAFIRVVQAAESV